MVQLIIRADDVGYSEAVNFGIAKSIEGGLVGSVGVMPNMPAAQHGLNLLHGKNICLGQHTNICLGKPCAAPNLIPSLLNENGEFKNSKEYRAAFAKGEDFVNLKEVVLEIEAQYIRFKELTGREPDYFEAHAVTSPNLYRGLKMVAERYGLPYSNMSPMDTTGIFAGHPIAACPMGSMNPEYDPVQCLKDAVENAHTDMPNVFVCHPGYLDAYLLQTSSLTVNRAKEVEMLCNPAVREWLIQQKVQLITYRDI